MRWPTALGLTLLVSCAFCIRASLGEDARPQKDATFDLKLLQGNWKVVALEADGRKAPPEALKGMRWSFKGAEAQFVHAGEKLKDKCSVKLDSGKNPKHINLVGIKGPQKGKTIQGIFSFEMEQLVICLRDTRDAKKGRPSEFMTGADSGLGMITLERIKE